MGGSNPHPPNKKLVARRLAEIALVRTYEKAEHVVYGPMMASHSISGDTVTLKFRHIGGGLKTRDGKSPDWLEVSDGSKDGNRLKYVKADAKITGSDTVKVRASGVDVPRYVRFAWHNLARHNLVNKEGLPAVSFRTDTQRVNGWR